MKAALRGQAQGLDQIQLTDLPDPGKPTQGKMRVRILSNSLNFHDYLAATGVLPTETGRLLMADGAGIVEEIGEGITEFAVGDHVVSVFFPHWTDVDCPHADFSHTPGDGLDGYATSYVVRPENWFTHAPKGWTHHEAATLPTAGSTAWRALVVEGKLKAGDDVLILGTGGVSIFALQLALKMGARVWAITSSNEKAEWLRQQGVSGVVNYREEKNWGEKIFEMTGNRGVDQVVEIGGAGTLAQSIAACRIGGHITLIGVFTGIAGDVPTGMIMAKQLTVKGVTVAHRDDQKKMIRALEATGIHPIIDKVFPLTEIKSAFEYQLSGQHIGKICLEIK